MMQPGFLGKVWLPFGKPKRCLETDGVEIAKAYEKVYELERRLTLLESRRIRMRRRNPESGWRPDSSVKLRQQSGEGEP